MQELLVPARLGRNDVRAFVQRFDAKAGNCLVFLGVCGKFLFRHNVFDVFEIPTAAIFDLLHDGVGAAAAVGERHLCCQRADLALIGL